MTIEEIKQHIRTVPDFPTQGIMFKDLTTAFKNAECMKFFEDTIPCIFWKAPNISIMMK